MERISTRCCIAGGGPAGVMLGFLLARAGVDVVVLEKHADFLRDFRGDTIHPSTLEVMHELGLLETFLRRPHQEARELRVQIGEAVVTVAEFSHLPTRCKFIALMPQWDFLSFLSEEGRRYRGFHLRTEAVATELIDEGGRIAGLRAETPQGPLEIRADLTVGADGRHSTVRAKAGLKSHDIGAPMDVLWMRLSRRPNDPVQTMGRIEAGRILVMLDRGDYWQCAYVIPKGTLEEIRGRGLDAFRGEIVRLAPHLADRIGELADWDDIKLLTVAVDRLVEWHRPGLLCIGDAAHAMSPIGGVGVNLAIQDAVAAANILAEPLRQGTLTRDHLAAVERRRVLPTRLTQALQVMIQKRIITRVLGRQRQMTLAWPLKLLRSCPPLRRIPARVLGLGFWPEHVRISAAIEASPPR